MTDAAALPEPGPDNDFCAGHARLLRDSLRRWTGCDLLDAAPALTGGTPSSEPITGDDIGRRLFEAPFALLSHGVGSDPTFKYANRTALRLFELTWPQLLATPSRLSAEPVNQPERARLLTEVAARGFIDDYAGVRISRTGRRFCIRRATVWNLVDDTGTPCGQAAMFADWEPVA
ncbi:MAG: MEKHLA domain-containing protein [Defluviicoccus sp.]|nr:MAG: MEKHLA domain-containing protein [Defluviicoccus sp.]